MLSMYTLATIGQSEAMGEPDNAKVSLVGLVSNINLINLGRIEEYATLSPTPPAILIIMFEGSGDNFGKNDCGTFLYAISHCY
jgi:hypothetical protein